MLRHLKHRRRIAKTCGNEGQSNDERDDGSGARANRAAGIAVTASTNVSTVAGISDR